MIIRVRCAGVTAAAVLEGRVPLTVAAVFDRSFYCRDGADRWLCFLRDDLEPGPLHALATGWPERLGDHLGEGQTLAATGHDCLSTSAFTVDFGGFQLWQPPPFPPVDRRILRDALVRLRQSIQTLAPADTLARRVAGGEAGTEAESVQQTMLTEASRGVALLRQWLTGADDAVLDNAVQALVGLGPGLTPTGDDVLAGTLLALHALENTEMAAMLAASVEKWGVSGTNRISLAHLRAAAAGQGAAPFHDIVNCVLRNDDAFDHCLRRIDAVGHSSGWDILTGIVTTLESCI